MNKVVNPKLVPSHHYFCAYLLSFPSQPVSGSTTWRRSTQWQSRFIKIFFLFLGSVLLTRLLCFFLLFLLFFLFSCYRPGSRTKWRGLATATERLACHRRVAVWENAGGSLNESNHYAAAAVAI